VSDKPYDWGDPPREGIDWGLLGFVLGYVAVGMVLLHLALGTVR
jgi:hypothetical protein